MARQYLRLLKSGSVPDLADNLAPEGAWNQAFGCAFHNGAAVPLRANESIWGTGGSGMTANRPPGVVTYCPNEAGTSYWLTGTGTSGQAPEVWRFTATGPAYTNITPAAWVGNVSDYNAWTGGVMNTSAIMHSGYLNYPHFYNTTALGAATTVLPGWIANDYCRSIRPYKYHLIAMNMTKGGTRYPNRLQWSAAAASNALPATWTPAAGNEAGDVDLTDETGQIVDGLRLGEDFIVYKDNATYRLRYVGGNTVMAVEKLSGSSGLMSRNCAVDVGGAHVALTRGDVVLVEQTGKITSLADGKVKRRIADNLYGTYKTSSFVVYDPAQQDVWVLVPQSNNAWANNAFVLNLPSGSWSEAGEVTAGAGSPYCRIQGPLFETASSAAAAQWRGGIGFGKTTGSILPTWVALFSPDAGAGSQTPLGGNMVLVSNRNDLGEPDRHKTIYGMRLIGEYVANDTITVYIYTRTLRDGAATLAGTYSFVPGTTNKVDILVDGRFFDFQFFQGQADTYLSWRLLGFELEYELAGQW